ncbi:RNA polymerase sigma factor [Foetidibacter luteolus]|uniref:RNA polymerase sigma factor n=1 Tax=Foetidibacter luteolus TaxID=2608880 RepID=UPI00129B6FD1|nr:sigma-70 family RNA polymerase sigma factor [Foetidibacter luteolus]
MKTAFSESQLGHESDLDLIELMGMKADFPKEAMDAYGEVYSRYWREMLIIANNVTKDEDSAQDLLADTFNLIFERAHTFRRSKLQRPDKIRYSILGWMTTIMQHVFFDHYLDEAYKKPDEPLEESYIIDKKLVSKHLDDNYSEFVNEMEKVEQQVDGHQEPGAEGLIDDGNLAVLNKYLSTLSERDRDIILTTYAHHVPGKYTPGTVLDELERKWGTTRENIRKILEKIRKALKAELENKLVVRK